MRDAGQRGLPMTTTVLGISTGAVKRPRSPGLTPHPPATALSSAAACAQHGWLGDIGGPDVVAGEPDMAGCQRRRTGQRGDTRRYRRGAPGGPVVVHDHRAELPVVVSGGHRLPDRPDVTGRRTRYRVD